MQFVSLEPMSRGISRGWTLAIVFVGLASGCVAGVDSDQAFAKQSLVTGSVSVHSWKITTNWVEQGKLRGVSVSGNGGVFTLSKNNNVWQLKGESYRTARPHEFYETRSGGADYGRFKWSIDGLNLTRVVHRPTRMAYRVSSDKKTIHVTSSVSDVPERGEDTPVATGKAWIRDEVVVTRESIRDGRSWSYELTMGFVLNGKYHKLVATYLVDEGSSPHPLSNFAPETLAGRLSQGAMSHF